MALGVLASCSTLNNQDKQDHLAVLKSATTGKEKEYVAMYGSRYVREPHSYLDRKYGASDAERLAAFMALYAMGEDVKKLKDEYEMTGMSYAIRLNDRASVEKLRALGDDLQFGAYTEDKHDGDCCCSFDSHPRGYVHEALHSGHEELARYLLSCGAAPTGVWWCIANDNVSMLKTLLAAGGTVREDEEPCERGIIPNFVYAKSPEMMRYLFAETPFAQMDKNERIFLIRQYANEDGRKRATNLCLQAGALTPEDLRAYERGGIAQLDKRREHDSDLPRFNPIEYPSRRTSEDEPLWMPFADALRIFRALAGSDAAVQDAAVLMMLRHPYTTAEKTKYAEPHADQHRWDYFMNALLIVGDARFAAQLAKLTPKQLKYARCTIMWEDDNIPCLRKRYPRTSAKLNLRNAKK